jgi:hypothetical protein
MFHKACRGPTDQGEAREAAAPDVPFVSKPDGCLTLGPACWLDVVNDHLRYPMTLAFGSVSGPHMAQSGEPSKREITCGLALELLWAACSKRSVSVCHSIFTNWGRRSSGKYTHPPFSNSEFVAERRSSQPRGHWLVCVARYSTIKLPVVQAAYDSGILVCTIWYKL